jgi:hypothetical protein
VGRGRLGRRAPLVGLCLAGGALRFATLGAQSFWLDEAATGRLMRLGLGAMLRALPDGESTPPAYYVVAWLWTRVVGTGEVGLRSLSAVLGTLTIPVVYAAGVRWLGHRRAGLAAAALTAFGPLLIWYSQEARAYALLVLLSAASLWALAGAAAPQGGRRALAAWGTICALAVATHYFAAFVVAPQAVWLLRARGRRVWPAVAGLALAGVALAPLAVHQRAQNNAGFIAASPLGTRLAQAAKQLVAGYDSPGQVALTITAAACVAGLAWLWVRRLPVAVRPGAGVLGGVAAAAVVVPAVLAVAGLDYVITRNLIAAWVPGALALAAAGALAGRAGRGAGPALVAGLCAIGIAATVGIDLDARYQRDDWRAVARTVPAGGPVAVLLTPASGHVPFAYYLPASRLMAPGGAAVRWVEVIGLGVRGVGAPLRPPAIPPGQPGIAGFVGPFAERHPTFNLLRYRAIGPPVAVTPRMLRSLALGRGLPAAVLVGG